MMKTKLVKRVLALFVLAVSLHSVILPAYDLPENNDGRDFFSQKEVLSVFNWQVSDPVSPDEARLPANEKSEADSSEPSITPTGEDEGSLSGTPRASTEKQGKRSVHEPVTETKKEIASPAPTKPGNKDEGSTSAPSQIPDVGDEGSAGDPSQTPDAEYGESANEPPEEPEELVVEDVIIQAPFISQLSDYRPDAKSSAP